MHKGDIWGKISRTQMRVIPERSGLIGCGELVKEAVALYDRTLGDKRWSICPCESFVQEETVPVLKQNFTVSEQSGILHELPCTHNAGRLDHGRVIQVVDDVDLQYIPLLQPSWKFLVRTELL